MRTFKYELTKDFGQARMSSLTRVRLATALGLPDYVFHTTEELARMASIHPATILKIHRDPRLKHLISDVVYYNAKLRLNFRETAVLQYRALILQELCHQEFIRSRASIEDALLSAGATLVRTDKFESNPFLDPKGIKFKHSEISAARAFAKSLELGRRNEYSPIEGAKVNHYRVRKEDRGDSITETYQNLVVKILY